MLRFQVAGKSDIKLVQTSVEELSLCHFESETFEANFLAAVNTGLYFPFLLYQDDQHCGYLSIQVLSQVHHGGKVAEIMELVVLPSFRNQEIGKQALDFAIDFAQQQGCLLIELATNRLRVDAHRFYEKNQFVKSHYKFTKKL